MPGVTSAMKNKTGGGFGNSNGLQLQRRWGAGGSSVRRVQGRARGQTAGISCLGEFCWQESGLRMGQAEGSRTRQGCCRPSNEVGYF